MTLARRLGVLGWPVAHSLSPAMHNAALRQLGLSAWRYQLLPVPAALFEETVAALPGAGFRGANVTIPHKQTALALADSSSVRAAAIGAANTLTFTDGGTEADNTDAPALIELLPFGARGRGALVMGAGGSARAAVWALLDGGAAAVYVWNRSPERARALCAELGATPVAQPVPADILVNCTSVGMDGKGELPLRVHEYGCILDLVYGPAVTPLAEAGRKLGIAVVEGLEVLVAQGALSFERFTSRPAPLEAMRAAVGIVASR